MITIVYQWQPAIDNSIYEAYESIMCNKEIMNDGNEKHQYIKVRKVSDNSNSHFESFSGRD